MQDTAVDKMALEDKTSKFIIARVNNGFLLLTLDYSNIT